MSGASTGSIAVVDYRAGNLSSVVKALRFLGAEPEVTSDPGVVSRAAKILLPGVGHFAATRLLAELGLTEAIRSGVGRGVPFFGICVGLQWIFEGSTEAPEVAGAAFLEGRCERFETIEKVPHVGWNSISVSPGSRLMKGIDSGEHVYFTHSYRAPIHQSTVAVAEYGGPFTAAMESGNLMGVQFHPEKSGRAGLQILKNFLEL
jgi:glutamine amidotransferase